METRILVAATLLLSCLAPGASLAQTATRPRGKSATTERPRPASGTATRPPDGDWAPEGSDIVTFPAGFDATQSDPRAIALAVSAQEAMGGLKAWQEVPSIRFAFVVERDGTILGRRLHYWDLQAGRHRVEMQDRESRAVVITQLLGQQQGEAFRDGKALAGEDLAAALKQGHAAWVNDTYWLIMPFKTFDPGVRLSFEGSRTRQGVHYRLVKVSFDQVGLTPGDVYHAWINDQTRRMDFWSYRLQSMKESDPETMFAWEDWRSFGDVTLSLSKRQVDQEGDQPGLTIRFENVALLGPLPDGLFQAGAEPPAGLAP